MFVCKTEMIDWKQELRKKNPNWKKIVKKSEDFCTCLVGHQSSVIPRTQGGVPSFKELEKLGYEFMDACSKKDKEFIYPIFKKIARSSMLKSKDCIRRIKKIFKKSPEKFQEYLDGKRTFHVSVDKEGHIVAIKDDSKFIVYLSDEFKDLGGD